jgi:hypothetical protein
MIGEGLGGGCGRMSADEGEAEVRAELAMMIDLSIDS